MSVPKRRNILGRFAIAILWLLSYNWRHTVKVRSIEPVAVALARPADQSPKLETTGAVAARRSASLSARLATVAKLNAPASRAPYRTLGMRAAQKAIPILTKAQAKNSKQTTLPTSVAVRNMQLKPIPTATIIDIATARRRHRMLATRKAA